MFSKPLKQTLESAVTNHWASVMMKPGLVWVVSCLQPVCFWQCLLTNTALCLERSGYPKMEYTKPLIPKESFRIGYICVNHIFKSYEMNWRLRVDASRTRGA